MKILLVGEYSRLHNSLKEGLQTLNQDVTLIATGDSFKKFPVDFSIAPKFLESNSFLKFVNKAFFKIFKSDLRLMEKGIRFYFFLPKLKNFDIVQLINSDAIETYPTFSRFLLKKLFTQNKKVILLVCGEDTPVIDFLLKNEMKYSILSPLLENKKLKNHYHYSLKYVQNNYRKLFDFVNSKASALIVSDLDYKIPMEQMGFTVNFIPNPVNTEFIAFQPLVVSDKIILFLGINQRNYEKKGIVFFEKALATIAAKYSEKVDIIVTQNLPYQQYIDLYNTAHIVLDQVYSYDQGYNALEAMAKGKVVFTGAETEFKEYFNLAERVNINALPDVDYLVNELSFLIENPEELIAIGKRARAFVEKEHNYKAIAQRYLEVWK